MSENLLDTLLSIAEDGDKAINSKKTKQLKEVDLFNNTDNTDPKSTTSTQSGTVHNGDTDSSDDEDNKYYEDRKYNDSGKNIRHALKQDEPSSSPSERKTYVTWKTKLNNTQTQANNSVDVCTEFGIRIVNPLISSTTLKDRMTGREFVPIFKIASFVSGNVSDKNWVIVGVIVGKSNVRTSQKGNQFLIWTLSDLKNDMKTVSMFLFNNAYKQLWKTIVGTVVGVLNPSVMERKNGSKDEATMSVDNAQKVMILGQSKDLGTCRSVKKNGEPCTSIVNLSKCDYCLYHIKQEYQKCSRRSELQSNFAGKGLTALRNKVLGKNEVFYAGKSYMAIPAKRSKKMEERNETLIKTLDGKFISNEKMTKKNNKKSVLSSAALVERTRQQKMKDLALLDKLGGSAGETFTASPSMEVNTSTSKKLVSDVLQKLKSKKIDENEPSTSNQNVVLEKSDLMKKTPVLSAGFQGTIDLSTNFGQKKASKAKLTALKLIQKNGPLKKSDPNSVKKSGDSKKRPLELLEPELSPKKQKLMENEFLSDRFKKMLQATSKHSELLDIRDNEEADKYFYKLEKKEEMEEKMINTFKAPCKAVRCLQCKYTSFSAAQLCKDNKHPLRVFDTVKRFFKCGNCGNRTVSLEFIPKISCANCGSCKWERTGMMKEKTVQLKPELSIRGGEQKFVNSVATNSNLDLLLPTD